MADYNWNERHIITIPEDKITLQTKDLHVYYGNKEAIKGIDMQFEKNKITALFSGALRQPPCINSMGI